MKMINFMLWFLKQIQTPNEHYETLGFDTEKQVYNYLQKLQN